ncbi:hypothetical protein ACFX13_010058 [Malus domestica]
MRCMFAGLPDCCGYQDYQVYALRVFCKSHPLPNEIVAPQRQSIVDGMRMIALKLEFGVSHNQIFERTLAVHFTDPFHVSKRVADKCNDGTLLLQGVDPSIRAEVWPFLLGVRMDGSSSQSSAHMVSVLGAEEANNLHKF